MYNKFLRTIRGLCLIFIVIAFCSSCKNLKVNREIKGLFGTKVDIPENLSIKIFGKDTLFHNQEDIFATLLIWYDSLQCTSCNLDYIEEWNRIYEYSADSITGFKPIIIFSPSRKELYKFEILIKVTDFKYPIYVDYDFAFADRNSQIASFSSQKVFLLDKKHEIVLVGNPFLNKQMWKLYKSTINTLVANKGVIP